MDHINNPAWGKWPWRKWKSPFEQAKVLPTFVINEWMYRLLTITTFYHAKKTNNLGLWFSSWICGTFNDAFFMAMPFCDNFWQAQSCIMLTPRMPLYIVEMYASILYCSTTTARRFGLPYLSEGALCGVLAHLLYHTYDINGPRYLWWTWHDGDPAISKRQLNAPIGSSLWILTYCALHCILNRWVNDSNAIKFGELSRLFSSTTEMFLTQIFGKITSQSLRLMESISDKVDLFHSKLINFPTAMKIIFCGSVCTPLFMMAMGQFQIFSLDVLGVPGKRTYRLAVLIYLSILSRAVNKKEFVNPVKVSAPHQQVNLTLLRAIIAFYFVQTSISLFGKPEMHLSTGCHQKVGEKVIVKDMMGHPRSEHLNVEIGPENSSKTDYQYPNPILNGTYDAAGQKIILPDMKEHSEWYTVVGIPHAKNSRLKEFIGVFSFSVMGSLLYGWALSGPYS